MMLMLLTLLWACSSTPDSVELKYVVTAAETLEPGTVISREHSYSVEVEADEVPMGVFLSPTFVEGRIVEERILQPAND